MHYIYTDKIQKQVSTTKKCHNYRPQANLSHRDKETLNKNTQITTVKNKANNSLFFNKIIAKLEKITLRPMSQNKDQTQN